MKDKWTRFAFRQERTRRRLRETAHGLPRLTIHRSLRYIYAQVIDDAKGKTLAAATSALADIRQGRKSSKNIQAAKAVGKLVAEKALKAGVKRVVFDRGGHIYHGRVKAIAEAAREAGLKF